VRILVTGHRGYIGGHLYRKLVRLGYEVDGIDLKNGEDILHCLPNKNYDYVFHLAALPRVEFSVENPSYTLKQNVLVTSTLLEWSLAHNIKRFIFSSSSAAMGDGTGPKSPYGLHKLISEMECKLYSDLYDLDTTCLRYFNAYSEDQQYGGSYSTAICAWMEMIRKNKPLRFDGDGNQTRDLVHVEDIVSANIFLMKDKIKKPEECLNGKVFEVGSGESVSMNYIKDFIDSKHSVKWNYAPTRPGDVRHTLADITELKKYGWEPKVSINEGLNRCFKKVI
jgi:UDP-glucose 4-epimerase